MSAPHEVMEAVILRPREIKRALFSLWNKKGEDWDGYLDIAKLLDADNVEILATGGTKAALIKEGVRVKDLDEFFREHAPAGQTPVPSDLFDGFIRTISTQVFSAAFARYDDTKHEEHLELAGSARIDAFFYDPYPEDHFESRIADPIEAAFAGNDTGGIAVPKAAVKAGRWVVYPTSVGDFTLCYQAQKDFDYVAANQTLRLQAQEFIFQYERARAEFLEDRIKRFDFAMLAN